MNRFEYIQAKLKDDETYVSRDRGVKIYDGDEKTNYEDGEVVLTTHRLFWGRSGEISKGAVTLCLQLKYIVGWDEETASSFIFGKKIRIILNLRPPLPDKIPGPMDSSTSHFIKLSGKNGLDIGFSNSLKETIQARIWEVNKNDQSQTSIQSNNSTISSSTSVSSTPQRHIKLRTGIGGIERSIDEKHKQTDENIAMAFQDLKILMAMAKDMVNISKVISQKIRERKGDISEDETIQFKSYLMSLGIDDPVTRDNFTSNTEYYRSLSQQICEMLLDPLEEVGGMMSLSDAYCRINRARGLELLSPEDLLNACKLLNGPIKLRQFPSGAMVLQLESHDDNIVANETANKINEEKSLTVEELAKIFGISMLLAKERLLVAERLGKICRDESVEGLRYYPNLFLRDDN